MNISQILEKFKENKSSKVGEFGYIYPELLHSLINKNNVVILEIGQRRGETFQTLLDVLPNAIVYGIDIGIGEYKKLNVKENIEKKYPKRAKLFIGDQADENLLNKIGNEVLENYGGFDLIMDDGGHTMTQQQTSLKILSSYMKPFGIYVIEDIETSYYRGYFGGGKIGTKGTTIDLLKNLIDVINRDYTRGHYVSKRRRRRNVENYSIINNDDKISSIRIFPNCAVLYFGYWENLHNYTNNKFL